MEFFWGIANPIGYKVGPSKNPEDIVKTIKVLNPFNEMGKIVLIVWMGNRIDDNLPNIARKIKEEKLNVVWVSDPMHGNTY